MTESTWDRDRLSFSRREGVRGQRLSAKAPIRHMDISLLIVAFGLSAVGSIFIKSASQARLRAEGVDDSLLLKRQLLFLALAAASCVVVMLFDYRQLRALSPVLYGAGTVLLMIVLTPLGRTALGAQRWIDLGVLQIQPSELMKIVLIITVAAALASDQLAQQTGPRKVAVASGITALPAFLTFIQPDLGTVMVTFAIVFALLVVGGTRLRWLVMVLVAGILAMGLAVQVGVLKDYQVARLSAFLDSENDSKAAGYNLAQSKIAIGSGGLSGTGYGEGKQTNLRFVPSQHTDFVFTAIAEEQGFLGGTFVLGLFALLLWRSLRIALLSKDLFGTLVASGIAAMFGFQIFVNIGMTMGIMPITGIPLPFVSYGGSSLITNFLAIGALMNIHMRRFI